MVLPPRFGRTHTRGDGMTAHHITCTQQIRLASDHLRQPPRRPLQAFRENYDDYSAKRKRLFCLVVNKMDVSRILEMRTWCARKGCWNEAESRNERVSNR